jgi:hypothetical protein
MLAESGYNVLLAGVASAITSDEIAGIGPPTDYVALLRRIDKRTSSELTIFPRSPSGILNVGSPGIGTLVIVSRQVCTVLIFPR